MSKAGRKLKQGIKRQPNGQPSRVGASKPRDTVIAVRMRMYGVTKTRAAESLMGWEIGRMCLRGEFGKYYQPTLNTVEEYVEASADYLRIKNPQHPMPKAMDYMAGRGLSVRSDMSPKTIARIEARYEDVSKRLAQADSMWRIIFHEIAFHDRSYGPRGAIAVNACVKALRSG